MLLLPVSVHVGGAEGVAVVEQRGVHQRIALRVLHQVPQVAQVAVAASHAIAGAVFVQDEHLPGTEPPLMRKRYKSTTSETIPLIKILGSIFLLFLTFVALYIHVDSKDQDAVYHRSKAATPTHSFLLPRETQTHPDPTRVTFGLLKTLTLTIHTIICRRGKVVQLVDVREVWIIRRRSLVCSS